MRTANQTEIDFINAHRALSELAAEDVYVAPFLLINSAYISKYAMFLHPKAVKQTAKQAGMEDSNGLNFKVMHTDQVVSLGKSFAGGYDKKTASSYVKFYFPRGLQENGYSVDDLIRGIDAGVYAETSFGFQAWPMKPKSIACSLCGGNPLWLRAYYGAEGDWCGHIPGQEYVLTADMVKHIQGHRDAGMDSYSGMTIKEGSNIEARMWMMDTENLLDELSLVDRGASESRPVRENELPMTFSAANDHPAFKLAAAHGDASAVKGLLHDVGFSLSLPFSPVSGDDIDLPGGNVVANNNKQGGEKKLSLKTKIQEFLGSMEAEAETVVQPVIIASAHDTEALKVLRTALEGVGIVAGVDVAATLATMKGFEADAKKYGEVPVTLRERIEKAELSWESAVDFIKTVETELDTVCTDYIAAAVAVKGNDVKPETLRDEITVKAKALGVDQALKYGRQMIATLKASEPAKPGQVTAKGAPEAGTAPTEAEKEAALRAMAKSAVEKFNKN